MVEQSTENAWVAGSSPACGTIPLVRLVLSFLCLLGIAYAQRLAPGDRIRLICEQEPTLSVERVLSSDGDVTLPIIGRIALAGKFIAEAEYEIARAAGEKLGQSRLFVAITLLADETADVEFSGAVVKNGSLPFRAGLRLADIVEIAQPTGSAATEAVQIHSSDGKTVFVDLTSEAGPGTLLRPGDRIFFPKATGANEVYILGAVQKPGSKEFRTGMTLRELVEIAGGVTGHGVLDQIRIDRKGQEPQTVSLAPESPDIVLQRGDAVTVPLTSSRRYVVVNGLVMKPGSIAYREGITLTEVIRAAGGLMLFGRADKITVRRVGEVPYWTKTFNLTRIRAGKDPDLVLRPADVIEVPLGELRPATPPSKKPVEKKPRTNRVVPPR